jgi:hypothetical protein
VTGQDNTDARLTSRLQEGGSDACDAVKDEEAKLLAAAPEALPDRDAAEKDLDGDGLSACVGRAMADDLTQAQGTHERAEKDGDWVAHGRQLAGRQEERRVVWRGT